MDLDGNVGQAYVGDVSYVNDLILLAPTRYSITKDDSYMGKCMHKNSK